MHSPEGILSTSAACVRSQISVDCGGMRETRKVQDGSSDPEGIRGQILVTDQEHATREVLLKSRTLMVNVYSIERCFFRERLYISVTT